MDPDGEHFGEKMVPELLSEQIEAADVLVMNKIDLAGEEQVKIATKVATAMNDKAAIFEVKYGAIRVEDVIKTPSVKTHEVDECNDPECKDSSHSHSHEHNAHSHDHSHSHDHDSDTVCNDPTHDHSHSHDHDDSSDSTHDHSHSHDHDPTTTHLGITNFVYKRDRPFNAIRLLNVLNKWPIPIKDELDLDLLSKAAEEGATVDDEVVKSPFAGVLRSKGFCWMAPTNWNGPKNDSWRHNSAMYWSHAGKHFGLETAGKWWACLPKERMKALFLKNEKEYERILREDFTSEEFGDRRQEVVFIGINLSETEITDSLDACLCTDEEMEEYRKQVDLIYE